MKKNITTILMLVLFQYIGYSQIGEWRIVDSLRAKVYQTIKFTAIDCADTNNCVIAANYGWTHTTAFTSFNGGNSWSLSLVDSTTKINNSKDITANEVAYPDTSFCIIVSDGGYYYISRDKCKTWELNRLDTNNLVNAYFIDNKIGGMISYSKLCLTKDGGKTWTKIYKQDLNIESKYLPDYIEYLYMKSPEIIYLLCYKVSMDSDYLIKSTDGGNTWEFLSRFEVNKSFRRVSKFVFIDDSNIVAVGSKDKYQYSGIYADLIYKSTDGGYSWDIKIDSFTKSKSGLKQVYFSDNKSGIALGAFWDLWRTSDGGDSWFQDTSYHYPMFIDCGVDLALLGSTKKFLIVNEMNGYVIKYSEDGITGIVEPDLQENESFRIYPNIISSGGTIKFAIPETGPGIIRLEIYNSIGIVVDSFEFSSPGNTYLLEYTLHNQLVAGRYFVRLIYGGRQAAAGSFIVE